MLPSLVVPAQSICRRNGRDTFERIILCPKDETWKISNLQRAKEYGAPVLFMYKGGLLPLYTYAEWRGWLGVGCVV